MTKRKLRKKAEIKPPQSPHDGIHTCSKGCKKPDCTRTLRDTIEEQDKQIEALKRDVLEQAAEVRQLRFKRVHDIHHIREQCEEIARLKAEVGRLGAFKTHTIIPNEKLQAQVERLTKAGDNLERVLTTKVASYEVANASHEWRAAKDGKDAQ